VSDDGTVLTGTVVEAVPYRPLMLGLAVLVALLFVASLAIGYVSLDLMQAGRDVLAGKPTLAALVLIELRLPRALLGGLVGFSLGITGAAMQGLMRNPLAEPGIIGVSGAAALGAVTTFYFGLAGALSLAFRSAASAARPQRLSCCLCCPVAARQR
jgi:iron complex transport system permease protein